MFTQQEAESFVKTVLQNILAKGENTLLDKFYSEKFTGHYRDETFDIQDILKRVLKVKNKEVECSYNIKNVVIVNDFIINTSDLTWTELITNNTYTTTQVSVWLIKNERIEESWIIMDSKTDANIRANEEFTNTPNSPGSYTQVEARIFFEDLYQTIFVNNNLKLLNNYYMDDFIGHCDDEVFDLEDIKQRAMVLNNYTENVNFFIRKIMVSDQLATVSSKVSFVLKSTGSIYEVLQYATFLIQDKKIKEAWIVHDNEIGSYKQYNQPSTWELGSDLLIPFEINQKKKEEYLERIKMALDVNERNYSVPKRELECLYYYLAGYSAKETAVEMNVSPRTIESYLLHIKNRFNCKNRIELRNILFPKL